MEDLSLHLLDLLENSIRARSMNVKVRITEDRAGDEISMVVEDDGEGMEDEECRRAADPFFTTKEGKRVGLGLSLLAQAAQEAQGGLEVASGPRGGTRVCARFRMSHIDRKPMGRIHETIRCVSRAHPGIRIEFEHVELDNGGHDDRPDDQ